MLLCERKVLLTQAVDELNILWWEIWKINTRKHRKCWNHRLNCVIHTILSARATGEITWISYISSIFSHSLSPSSGMNQTLHEIFPISSYRKQAIIHSHRIRSSSFCFSLKRCTATLRCERNVHEQYSLFVNLIHCFSAELLFFTSDRSSVSSKHCKVSELTWLFGSSSRSFAFRRVDQIQPNGFLTHGNFSCASLAVRCVEDFTCLGLHEKLEMLHSCEIVWFEIGRHFQVFFSIGWLGEEDADWWKF